MDNNEAFELQTPTEQAAEESGLTVVETPDELVAAEPEEKKDNGTIIGVFDWVDSVVASVITVIVIFTFFFRIVGIDGPSMNDTLEHGDRVIIQNVFYTPERGDIVVISRNASNDKSDAQEGNEPIIKRVIATEGESVDIRFEDGNGYVYVNGILLNEPYIKECISPNFVTNEPIDFPVVVPDGCVFVLGDNRNYSLDSRSALIGNHGMIDKRYIMGQAVARISPFDKMGAL